MSNKKIVFGVGHDRDNAPTVLSEVLPYIRRNNVVGLEAPERYIGVYKSIDEKKLTIEDSERDVCRYVINRWGGRNFSDDPNQFDPPQTISSALFFYRLYKGLLETDTKVVGLGSEKLLELANYYASLGHEETYFFKYWLLISPHFDRFLVNHVSQKRVDRIIVGAAHGFKIASLINASLYSAPIERYTLDRILRFEQIYGIEQIMRAYQLPSLEELEDQDSI